MIIITVICSSPSQSTAEDEINKMYIDPGSKKFVLLFFVVILGTIGFFVTTIFVDFRGDIKVETINFENSNFHLEIKQFKSDKSYVIQVFSGKLINVVI